MNELEEYLGWIKVRLDQDGPTLEEPDLEIKSDYKHQSSESEAVWELADLLAALSNEVRTDGYRALVYGPQPDLRRPSWLPDESRLRDKLLRHFCWRCPRCRSDPPQYSRAGRFRRLRCNRP